METFAASKAITQSQKSVLDLLSQKGITKDFYLAGGTALAIQLEHRKSVDLDFFKSKNFDENVLTNQLIKMFGNEIKIRHTEKATVHANLKKVNISFIKFEYKLLEEFIIIQGLRTAALKDIAAMKLLAITHRSTKKDFIDLYFLIKWKFQFSQIMNFYRRKFGKDALNQIIITKSLHFFDDAENDKMPVMLKPCKWTEVKDFIVNESEKYFDRIATKS